MRRSAGNKNGWDKIQERKEVLKDFSVSDWKNRSRKDILSRYIPIKFDFIQERGKAFFVKIKGQDHYIPKSQSIVIPEFSRQILIRKWLYNKIFNDES